MIFAHPRKGVDRTADDSRNETGQVSRKIGGPQCVIRQKQVQVLDETHKRPQP
jgi:hypothetical protein